MTVPLSGGLLVVATAGCGAELSGRGPAERREQNWGPGMIRYNAWKKGLARVTGAAIALALCAPGHADEIGYLNWSDYTPEDVLTEFEGQHGISVIHDSYNESDDAEAMLQAGNSGYDVAVVAMAVVDRLRASDFLARIDDNRLPNADGVDSKLMERFYEQHPTARGYIQPFLWGYSGLAVDRAAVEARIPDAPLDSWALLFDPEYAARLADCGIYIINSPDEVVSTAMVYLGRSPNSQDPQDIDDAFEAIAAIAPYVQDIESAHYDVLMAGEACLALTWNTEVVSVIMEEERPELAFFAPKEGTNFWLDAMVIPSDAPHPDNAYAFIDHVLDPEISAMLVDWNYTPSAVTAAQALMDPSMASDPMVIPPDEQLDSWFVARSFTPDEKADIHRKWWRLFLGI